MCGQRLQGTVPPGPPQLGSWTCVSQNSAPGLPAAGVLTRVSQNSAPGLPAAGVLTHVSQNSAPGLPAAGVLTHVSQNSAPGPPAIPLEPALSSCRLQQTNSLVSAATALLQRVSRWKVKLKNQVFRDLTAGHTFWSRNEGS